MLRRKHQLHEDYDDASKFVHLDENSDGGHAESAKGKTKAEPSRGFFRRGGQYDELRDDASSGSSSPAKSMLDENSRGEAPVFERDSASSAHTQISAILGTCRSIGFPESIRSRLSNKEDSSSGVRKSNDDPNQGFVAAPLAANLPSKKDSSRQLARKSKNKKASSDAHSRSKSKYASIPSDGADSIHSSCSQDLSVPHSVFATKDVNGAAANGKHTSPGLLPKLAASFGQGSRRGTADLPAMGSSDHLRIMDDSAMDSTADFVTPPLKPSRLGILPARQQQTGHISPGQTRPLLNGSATPGSLGFSSATSSNPATVSTPDRFHTTSRHEASWGKTSTDSLPTRRRSDQPMENKTDRHSRRTASEGTVHQDTEHPQGVRQLPDNCLDIFEPRPPPATARAPADPVPTTRAGSDSLQNIPNMTGHEALRALEEGALLKKKWLGCVDTREAPAMSKTERLIRCRLQNGKVILHYHHKGVKGLLDKEEVCTHVQRVETVDGPWREQECLLLHTGRGILALSAPDAATYLTWTLGLNAALKSSQQEAGNLLLSAPVHAIPRDSMFVVKGSH